MMLRKAFFVVLCLVLFIAGSVGADSLIAHWEFDEDPGSTASDSSGNGNTGTLYNMDASDWVGGYEGTALDFDGSNDYVSVADSNSISVGNGDFTISAWIYPHTTSGGRVVIAKVNGNSEKEYCLTIDNGKILFEIERSANDGKAETAVIVTTGDWQHIKVTYEVSSTDVTIYYNGTPQTLTSDTIGSPSNIQSDDLYIGRRGGTYNDSYFDGLIDDVKIFNSLQSDIAHNPSPANGGSGNSSGTLLSFSPGSDAYSHDVYFGNSQASVSAAKRNIGDIFGDGLVNSLDMDVLSGQWLSSPQEPFADLDGNGDVNLLDYAIFAYDWCRQGPFEYKGNQTNTSYSTGPLVEGNTYYWRIDEVNGLDIYEGNVWSFTAEKPPLDITTYPGWDIYTPPSSGYGYRYGPSIIINADDSIDVWFASQGGGGEADWVRHKKSTDGGHTWGSETIALRPTPGSDDWWAVCDPGVIKFGGYYYIGYTACTNDNDGVENEVYVARSTSATSGFAKWNGSGWGGNPQAFINFTGTAGQWGAGEPSFVLKDGTIYVYYTWKDGGNQLRLCTADASNSNWPGALTYQGVVINGKPADEDSCDLKYIDAKGKFICVSVRQRFSTSSYIRFMESTDGINFAIAEDISAYTAAEAHNMGISGTADGHLDLSDDNFIAYAYGGFTSWGLWPTYLNPIDIE